MNLKTFKAPTMAEAVAQVKRELGRDAVILRTRNRRKGGLWGWLRRGELWEVTASGNLDAPRPEPTGAYVLQEAADPFGGKKARRVADRPPTGGEDVSEIRRMVEALLAMHSASQDDQVLPGLRELRLRLLRQEVSEEIVEEMVRELSLHLTGRQIAEENTLRRQLQALIQQRIRVSPPPRRPAAPRARVSIFIGPTGVGKTTTIAKLAANFRIREGRKVGMVTIDTYRIAAVDQLKTYAELIEVPLHVVLTPGELAQAIEQLQDCDVVLIDTAGRSQNDRLRLNQLSAFLRAAEPEDVNLVVAATSSRSVVVSTLERFLPLGVNGIVMTKLDEAAALGSVLNVASVSRMPIRYVTTGQDVPDDISPTDPARLAQCIVEGGSYVV